MIPILTSNAADLGFVGQPGTSYRQLALIFDNANLSDMIYTQGDTLADMLAAIPAEATFTMQAAAVEDYAGGDVQARFRSGAWVNLGIDGNGNFDPVEIVAGTSGLGLNLRPAGSGTTLKFRPEYEPPE